MGPNSNGTGHNSNGMGLNSNGTGHNSNGMGPNSNGMGPNSNGLGPNSNRKILVFFQFSKNHNSVNFGRIKKSYLKKKFQIFFFI